MLASAFASTRYATRSCDQSSTWLNAATASQPFARPKESLHEPPLVQLIKPPATGGRPLHMISFIMHIISYLWQTESCFSFVVEGDLPS
jgi:hypothetical protein